jgi:hypothetical protein
MRFLKVCLFAVPAMGSGSNVFSRMVKRGPAGPAIAVEVPEEVDELAYGKPPSAPSAAAGPAFTPPPPLRGPSEALWGDRTKELFPAHLFADSDNLVEKALIPVSKNTYTIADTNWIVQYSQFCLGDHALEDRDILVRKEMNAIDPSVARSHIYTSKAIREPVSNTGTPKLNPKYWISYPCDNSKRMVRYHITARVDRTLSDILIEYERLPLHLVAQIGMHMIETLSRIHGGGIALFNGLSLESIGQVPGGGRLTIVAAPGAHFENEGFSAKRYTSYGSLLPIVGNGFVGYIDDVHDLVQLLAILTHGFTFAGDIKPLRDMVCLSTRSYGLATEANYFDLKVRKNGGGDTTKLVYYRISDALGVIPQHAPAIAAMLKQVVDISRSPSDTPVHGQIYALLKQVADMPHAMHPETIEIYSPLYESLGFPLPN